MNGPDGMEERTAESDAHLARDLERNELAELLADEDDGYDPAEYLAWWLRRVQS